MMTIFMFKIYKSTYVMNKNKLLMTQYAIYTRYTSKYQMIHKHRDRKFRLCDRRSVCERTEFPKPYC